MSNPRPLKYYGADNGRYKGGTYVTDKGYRKFSAGPNRGKFAHRVVMEQMMQSPLCAEYVFGPDTVAGVRLIPTGMDVEHCDHVKTHNCPGNLMLLSHALHSKLSAAYRVYLMNHWDEYMEMLAKKNLAESVPDWVTDDTDTDQDNDTDAHDGYNEVTL